MADNSSFVDSNGLLYFWSKIVSRIKGNVVNNLTSTDTDKALSAAQGKALDDKISAINTNMGNLGGGDMMKSAYDTNNDGKVDKAELADNASDSAKLGGQLPEYYAKKDELFSGSYNDLTDKPTDFAPTEHNHAISDINGLVEASQQLTLAFEGAVEDMTEIANGKCACFVFDEEAGLDSALAEYVAFINDGTAMAEENPLNGVTLKTGDVFLIRAVKVPDYWWDESTKSKQVLETTKVDLPIITNAEIDEIVAAD